MEALRNGRMLRNPYFNYIGATFSEALGGAINRAASSSPQMRVLLEQFEGNSIRFGLTDFSYEFVLSVIDGTVLIERGSSSDASEDVTVRTTLPKLVRLATSGKIDPASLEGVEISGDVRLVQQLYLVFTNLEFDWEDELSKRIGDIPARQAGNLMRWGGRQASDLRAAFKDSVRSSLVDEHYLVVERPRVERFLNDVDALQADVDRLEKRIERLERRGAS